MPGMVGPRMAELYGERAAVAQLCQTELPGQRMHRYPVAPAKPIQQPPSRSTAADAYAPPSCTREPARPALTLGWKNEIGTRTNVRTFTIDEFKAQKTPLRPKHPYSGGYESTAATSFVPPDQSHPTKGAAAERCGVTARMPFSEIDRHFFTSTSKGTLPGDPAYAGGHAKFVANSETRTCFDPKPLAPREPVRVTVRQLNDLGTRETSHAVPPEQLLRTNYKLGNECASYSTAAGDAALAPPPKAWKLVSSAAGQQVGVGPSEVARGFRQPHNSADYNIISNGPALGSSYHGGNTEAHVRTRNAAAFDKPVGLRQNPVNNPRDRGPTGSRQSYDIISGLDRPRERWNFQS